MLRTSESCPRHTDVVKTRTTSLGNRLARLRAIYYYCYYSPSLYDFSIFLQSIIIDIVPRQSQRPNSRRPDFASLGPELFERVIFKYISISNDILFVDDNARKTEPKQDGSSLTEAQGAGTCLSVNSTLTFDCCFLDSHHHIT